MPPGSMIEQQYTPIQAHDRFSHNTLPWMRILRRQSQKDHTDWEYLNKLIVAYWPALKIRHLWPDAPLVVKRASAT